MTRFQARVKNVRIYHFSDFYQKFGFSSLRESGAYGLTLRELKLAKMKRALKITYDRGFNHPNWSSLSRDMINTSWRNSLKFNELASLNVYPGEQMCALANFALADSHHAISISYELHFERFRRLLGHFNLCYTYSLIARWTRSPIEQHLRLELKTLGQSWSPKPVCESRLKPLRRADSLDKL